MWEHQRRAWREGGQTSGMIEGQDSIWYSTVLLSQFMPKVTQQLLIKNLHHASTETVTEILTVTWDSLSYFLETAHQITFMDLREKVLSLNSFLAKCTPA